MVHVLNGMEVRTAGLDHYCYTDKCEMHLWCKALTNTQVPQVNTCQPPLHMLVYLHEHFAKLAQNHWTKQKLHNCIALSI